MFCLDNVRDVLLVVLVILIIDVPAVITAYIPLYMLAIYAVVSSDIALVKRLADYNAQPQFLCHLASFVHY